ncbi:MAG TPA: pyruvate:ferredoxin (flavodoxin) oxidoreductase [Acidocella sp.]|jgi:pyruvate-ferredoxin/flavodoxin oxidoreductase|uniref:pyruvate:ferredoxin (flavodoxin) oxidoreductase n=1 Tax=Acidocella sp. TaxID=50710 RepID=UPI002D06B2EB|nr:pyruvate:ferredoxin (flavodoxin) oxidoreductase [Acidocella sp.]HVE23542.1 pyruvate:ferredoxin (flavodoxin) oxidoreductase [Acidocella sp.]
MSTRTTMDGNTAVADVAYRVNEVCAIYPITPSSTMAELADQWVAEGRMNIWGNSPFVQEMQSEGGAAGAVHGALQSGALTTTFTASQGLLLMLPNMLKIAGELTSTVFHVASRSVATSALSIFGDHSDVMMARTTGFALLSSASVQEAHDSALIAQMATLESRVPFLHFFDGFRTSHELNTLELLSDAEIRAMIDDDLVRAHRARALNPEHPFVRGTAHNPDTYFQAREAANPFYERVPGIVETAMDRFGALTGRHYRLFEYDGDPEAEQVLVLMGSGAETARATVAAMRRAGEKIGVLQVRLFRPFSTRHLLAELPASVRRIAVLEQTKESGAIGEPLFQDIVTSLAGAVSRGERAHLPLVIGGRYGISSKDFTPAMVKATFDELKVERPRSSFTVGIDDDVSHTSLTVDPEFSIEVPDVTRAMFFGLGADGTVGANKNSVKILAEDAGLFAQGYFVYDSHKSGAQTVSHLRFGATPIHAPYLIAAANFVACHQFVFLERQDVLRVAAPGATVLLNAPYPADQVWAHLPRPVQRAIIDKRLQLFVIDASAVARQVGLGQRTNTVLQTCFFAISGVLPREKAIAHIKESIRKTYGRKGQAVVDKNFAAVDDTLLHLHEVPVPAMVTNAQELPPLVPADAPSFVKEVTARMFAGEGDRIPVSLMPVDGTFPSGTSAYEKRNVSDIVPEWRDDLCIQCGQCSFVCPHSVIRARYYNEDQLATAPEGFKSAPVNARGYPEARFTLQFYVEDCTGCGLCVEACPATSPREPDVKAINMTEKLPILEREQANIKFFETLPVNDRARVDFANVRGVQFLEPLFQFPGACAGCGETPYLKLLSQLFGDRAQIANATGCSSIYGGNLPVTPWSKNHEGRGPAWSNSLFEDNAEFGLGFRLAADQHLALAQTLLAGLAEKIGPELADAIAKAPQVQESEIRAQRLRVAELKVRLLALPDDPAARDLLSVIDHLVRRSIWIVGGDGWAYDIGYGGLDHVLASGRNVNVLVLDTEVYSNTGGQASKATPLGAVAKFAAAGKRTARKDLALQAIAYGNVYVAQVAMGANPQQTLQAFREAEAYQGPSLILAYSHCIAHGIDMRLGLKQQDLATASGYWPLFRFNPEMRAVGESPFRLDSPRPHIPFKDYAYNEIRYRTLAQSRPAEAVSLMSAAQRAVNEKYRQYEDLAMRDGSRFNPDAPGASE